MGRLHARRPSRTAVRFMPMPLFLVAISVSGLALLAGVVWLVQIQGELVLAKAECEAAWSHLEALLGQRQGEVSKLVLVCRAPLPDGPGPLDALIAARGRLEGAKGVPLRARASDALSLAVRRLFEVADGLPALAAASGFLPLRQRLCELEAQLADRREFWNATARSWNDRIGRFPDSLLARRMGAGPCEPWPVDGAASEAAVEPAEDAV